MASYKTNYRKGAAFENRVRNRLTTFGMQVMRSAGSRGIADLVAYDAAGCWHIQCKLERPSGIEKMLQEIQRHLPETCSAGVAYEGEEARIIVVGQRGPLL